MNKQLQVNEDMILYVDVRSSHANFNKLEIMIDRLMIEPLESFVLKLGIRNF